MSSVGQNERTTQNRAVKLFQEQLDYSYYGDWHERSDNSNIEENYLRAWLIRQGVDGGLITNALRQFKQAVKPLIPIGLVLPKLLTLFVKSMMQQLLTGRTRLL